MSRSVGILTSGSDSPGMNAAIRAIGKSLKSRLNAKVVGFLDGFIGLVHNQAVDFEGNGLSGILTHGGTILGTSRDLPDAIISGGESRDLTDLAVETYHKRKLDALIIIGGREAQKGAFNLAQKGLSVITMPKAIDNDILGTDSALGFDSALEVATQSIDRLHSTAHSLHRIIIVEIMGRWTGWLTLGSGLAGGADVVLTPEIPYDAQKVANAILSRTKKGKRFSIIAVAEGSVSQDNAEFFAHNKNLNEQTRQGKERERVAGILVEMENRHPGNTHLLANQLEAFTGLETRTTILGYLLRGGIPTGSDRCLAAVLGNSCVDLVQEKRYGVMVGLKAGKIEPIGLEEVAGLHKYIPDNHPWFSSARATGIFLGNE